MGQAAAAPTMAVEMRPTQSVRPYERNAKRHAKSQVARVAASIREFGWAQPLVVDAAGSLIIGHCRLEAAKSLGLAEVPVVVMDALTDAQVRALRLADNRLNESAWDMELVTAELKLMDVGLVDLSGFSRDLLLETNAGDDDVPEPPKRPRTARGDLYELGDHRLMCGDATSADDVGRLTEGKMADMVFTDPPYVMYGNSNGAEGVTDDKMVSSFFRDVLATVKQAVKPFGHAYVCCDWRGIGAWYRVNSEVRLSMKNLIVWDKGTPAMGSMFRPQYEMIIFFSNSSEVTKVAGRIKGGQRTVGNYSNVWQFGRVGPKEKEHTAAKPVALMERAINISCDKGETVLDIFGGSGSTLMACEKSGRKCRMMEIEPTYCDVIVTRWERMTGRKAVKLAPAAPKKRL